MGGALENFVNQAPDRGAVPIILEGASSNEGSLTSVENCALYEEHINPDCNHYWKKPDVITITRQLKFVMT